LLHSLALSQLLLFHSVEPSLLGARHAAARDRTAIRVAIEAAIRAVIRGTIDAVVSPRWRVASSEEGRRSQATSVGGSCGDTSSVAAQSWPLIPNEWSAG
jgi:hypothetical protein